MSRISAVQYPVELLDSSCENLFARPRVEEVPFASAGWLQAWRRTLGAHPYRVHDCSFIVADGTTPLIYLPLAIVTKLPKGPYGSFGIRTLRWMGYPDSDTFLLPAVSKYMKEPRVQEVTRNALVRLYELCHAVEFDRIVPKDFDFLKEVLPRHSHWRVQRDYCIVLGSKSLLAVPKLRWAKAAEKSWQKLSQLGDLEYTSRRFESDDEHVLTWIMNQQASRFRKTYGFDFAIPKSRFYSSLARLGLAEFGEPTISTLKLDGALIAAHWGLRLKTNFYYMLPAFSSDTGIQRFSPGMILLQRIVIEQADRGTQSVRLGIGSQPYKERCSNAHQQLGSVSFPTSAVGALWLRARSRFILSEAATPSPNGAGG